MINAIAYVRVSTEEQATTGVSIDAQKAKIKAYCELRGLFLRAVVTDAGISAGKKLQKRKGGNDLLQALRKKLDTVVVVVKLDRLFRNAADCLSTVEDWDKRGVALHVIDLGGNSIDTKSAAGKFMLTMLAAVAEMERNMTRERTRDALQHKKAKGDVYCRSKFGKDKESGKFLRNGQEQAAIKAMKRMRDKGDSYQTIADYLHLTKIPTKRGGEWRAETVRKILKASS